MSPSLLPTCQVLYPAREPSLSVIPVGTAVLKKITRAPVLAAVLPAQNPPLRDILGD